MQIVNCIPKKSQTGIFFFKTVLPPSPKEKKNYIYCPKIRKHMNAIIPVKTPTKREKSSMKAIAFKQIQKGRNAALSAIRVLKFKNSQEGLEELRFLSRLSKPAGDIFTINVSRPETLQLCRRVSWPKCDRARSRRKKGVTLQLSFILLFLLFFLHFSPLTHFLEYCGFVPG